MNTWTCSICGIKNLITSYVYVNCGFDQYDTTPWLEQTEKDSD